MVQQKIVVVNPEGLHLRPAGIFAQEMDTFKCDVFIRYKGTRVNGKSLLSILTACIKCGSEIDIECDGEDELEAIARAIELISNGFDNGGIPQV